MSEVANCVNETHKAFSGLDIVVGNAGYTQFSAFGDLDALPEAEWDKCWAVNVKGMKQLVASSMPIFNENPEGGVVLITSSIAGKTLAGSSMPYSITKAAQLHMVKCIANTQGRKLRINAVLPGLLLTDWGNKYGEERINGLKNAAVLKQEVSLLIFSSFCVDLLSESLLILTMPRHRRPNWMTAQTCLSRSQRTPPSPDNIFTLVS